MILITRIEPLYIIKVIINVFLETKSDVQN